MKHLVGIARRRRARGGLERLGLALCLGLHTDQLVSADSFCNGLFKGGELGAVKVKLDGRIL